MNPIYKHPLVAPFINFFIEEFDLTTEELPGLALSDLESIHPNAKGGYLLPLNLIILSKTLVDDDKDNNLLFVFMHEFMHFLQGKTGMLSVKNDRAQWRGKETDSIPYKDRPEEIHVEMMMNYLWAQKERPQKGMFKAMFDLMGRIV